VGIFASGQTLTAAKLNALANNVSLSTGVTSTHSLTSTTSYANMAATSSVSITKSSAATALYVSATITAVSTATATRAMIGVNINGVDYDLFKMFFDVTTRISMAGGDKVASGLAVGTYTVQLRWKRISGAGQIDRFNADDWLCLSALEVQ